MEGKAIATSLGGDRVLIFPCSPRSSFVFTSRLSSLPLKRASIGGAVSCSGVNGLTRWNSIVSTRRLVPVRSINSESDSDSDFPHENQQVRFEFLSI